MKRLIGVLLIMIVVSLTPQTVFAGDWRQGAAPNEGRWWYQNKDGSYAGNGWFWLDGNDDGIAECYYFDKDGWMFSDRLTPDGYTVNVDGAWTESGSAQTREVRTTAETPVEGEDAMISMTIQVGDRQFAASLLDHASTQAFISRLPMTLSMGEMNGNEKYYYLPSALPTDARSVGNIRRGDLMLYGSDCLVLFYEDFRTSYRYTRLGSVSNSAGLAQALGGGNVSVTFRLNGR